MNTNTPREVFPSTPYNFQDGECTVIQYAADRFALAAVTLLTLEEPSERERKSAATVVRRALHFQVHEIELECVMQESTYARIDQFRRIVLEESGCPAELMTGWLSAMGWRHAFSYFVEPGLRGR